MDEREYLVCDLCGGIVLLETAFAYADERMLVCPTCTSAEFWTAGAGPADDRGGGLTRP